MEGSPATRLPEADALPDGFVESSSADQAQPVSSAPAAGDPLHPALGPDHEGAACAGGEETLGAPSTPADALRSLSMAAAASEPERAPEQQGPAADIGGAKDAMKESFVVEQAESLPNQKEIGEPKRKVVKRNSKLEKDRELLQLAQRYHGVVAERDAVWVNNELPPMADAMAAAAGETPPPQANYFFGRPWPELNEGLSYTDTFRGADAETTATLIDFYSENYRSSAPLPGWIHRIRNGQITVDDQVVTDPDMILREGSKLVYHRLAWKEPFAPHLLQVLYEDDDMVALNKPSGLQVLPKGLFQQRTVLAQLQWKEWKMPPSSCSKKKKVQLHPVPVHRLGRGTSGLLLCAKTKLAKVQLASHFAEGAANAEKKRDGTEVGKERKISKFYRALVTGILEHDKDVVTQPIGLVHYPGVAEGLYVACSSGSTSLPNGLTKIDNIGYIEQIVLDLLMHLQCRDAYKND